MTKVWWEGGGGMAAAIDMCDVWNTWVYGPGYVLLNDEIVLVVWCTSASAPPKICCQIIYIQCAVGEVVGSGLCHSHLHFPTNPFALCSGFRSVPAVRLPDNDFYNLLHCTDQQRYEFFIWIYFSGNNLRSGYYIITGCGQQMFSSTIHR